MQFSLHTVYLGTGTNMGDRAKNLRQARELIAERIGVIRRASQIYRTEAWGVKEQPDFFNQVLEVQTRLQPGQVLEKVLTIEQHMGRIRRIRWGARVIDIDILFYEDRIIGIPGLTVPHPHIAERRFVLVPMQEIAPDFRHPALDRTVTELLSETTDALEVAPEPRKES